MRIYKTDLDAVFFAGDLHGEFDGIVSTINSYNLRDCNIVVCGDIGFGFEKEGYYHQTFHKISKTLKKRNVHCYLIRGNHDDKAYFDGEHFEEYDYIHVLPDYSVIQTPSRNILAVGGATSIDRTMRIQHMEYLAADYARWHNCSLEEGRKNCRQCYWPTEAVVYDAEEIDKLDELGIKIDTVCTHTAPSNCEPFTKYGLEGWLDYDPDLDVDLAAERATCDMIRERLLAKGHHITHWYYGHFHSQHTDVIDGIMYKMLDMFRGTLDLSM